MESLFENPFSLGLSIERMTKQFSLQLFFDSTSRVENLKYRKQIKQRKRLFKLVLRGKGETRRGFPTSMSNDTAYVSILFEQKQFALKIVDPFASHYLKPFSFNISSFVPRLPSYTRFCFVFWHKIWQNSRIPVSSFFAEPEEKFGRGVCQWRLGNSYRDRSCLWILLNVD